MELPEIVLPQGLPGFHQAEAAFGLAAVLS
jgi:hypothetical protein